MRMNVYKVSLLLGLSVAASSYGSMIGVNFVGNSVAAADYTLTTTQNAGVANQVNWNNAKLNSGATADLFGPLAGQLADNTGVDSGAAITWSANGKGKVGRAGVTDDNVLMNGYLDDSSTVVGNNATVTFGSLNQFAADGYKVYVYFGAATDNRTGTISDGTTTFYTKTKSSTSYSFPADYTIATSTTDGTYVAANYAVFSGTADDLTLTYQRDSGNGGILGIQVVAVPEPATLGMLGLGTIITLLIRRSVSA